MNEEQILDAISLARMQNNKNWMALVALALKEAPLESRKILRRINLQDKKISDLLSRLSSEETIPDGGGKKDR